eukprot:SAG22_NODE_2272_length_2766_cov_4.135358_4_plen_97_part_01
MVRARAAPEDRIAAKIEALGRARESRDALHSHVSCYRAAEMLKLASRPPAAASSKPRGRRQQQAAQRARTSLADPLPRRMRTPPPAEGGEGGSAAGR